MADADTFMQCPDDGSAGTTYPEQFGIFAASLSAGTPIAPNSFVYLKSMVTGMWCRITTVVIGSTQEQVKCDAGSLSLASKVMYTGEGQMFTFQGRPFLINPEDPLAPVYLGEEGDTCQAGEVVPGGCSTLGSRC